MDSMVVENGNPNSAPIIQVVVASDQETQILNGKKRGSDIGRDGGVGKERHACKEKEVNNEDMHEAKEDHVEGVNVVDPKRRRTDETMQAEEGSHGPSLGLNEGDVGSKNEFGVGPGDYDYPKLELSWVGQPTHSSSPSGPCL